MHHHIKPQRGNGGNCRKSQVASRRRSRKTAGTTPHQFQLKKKYAYAAELLKTTDLTIGEICETVGIGDQYQFSKYFKKLYGVPPSRYRKMS